VRAEQYATGSASATAISAVAAEAPTEFQPEDHSKAKPPAA
jgi:hypothetical protein